MTIQVLFVQGGGEGAHDQWDNRLVDSLAAHLGSGYAIRYPRMPDEADPNYVRWKGALIETFSTLDAGAIVVGHSIGGTILVNALAESPPDCALGAIGLIAVPFVGPGGWPSEEIAPRSDLGASLPLGVPVLIYHGTKDETAPVAHADLYATVIPQARVRRLDGRDHQLNNDLAEVASDILRPMPSG